MSETETVVPQTPGADDPWKAGTPNLRLLQEIEIRLSVEVGTSQVKLRELLNLNEGSVVELDRPAGAPLDLYANGTLFARGEVVTVGGRFGVRITDIVAPGERVKDI